MQASVLYLESAEVFRPHIPYDWITMDELLIRLENRALFNVPGFCESTTLRKVLIFQACWSLPECIEVRPLMTAYGPTVMIRRTA